MEPPLARLLQSLFQDLIGQLGGLNVHLEGVHPLGGARHFEVHIAKEVLDTLDVAQDGVFAVVAGDQAHGDTGHRRLDWDTGVHQSQRGATDAAHGRAAVGTQAFGDHADGVGEVVLRWQYRQDGPFGQGPVSNLAASGRHDAPGFSGGE